MLPDEKVKLLGLLEHDGKWCRESEARNADGDAVRFDDATAVAWDITGALCRSFGWRRACVLFEQVERHLVGKPKTVSWPVPNPGIDAMRALQAFNDGADITFDVLRERLEAMPVWQGHTHVGGTL